MASLTPLSGNLDFRKAKHLLRRATFNYTKENIEAFTGKTATQAVEDLLIEVPNFLPTPYYPYPIDSPGGYYPASGLLDNTSRNVMNSGTVAWWWYNGMKETTLKHKLMFFLSTRFTVSKNLNAGDEHFFYDHMRLLEYYSYGNLRDLAKKINLDTTMQSFLGNNYNFSFSPNENYAREFLELFTILRGEQVGEGDYTTYTEYDVQQAARVLTGIRHNNRDIIDEETGIPRCTAETGSNFHDDGDKTFSAAFGNRTIIGTKASSEAMIDEFNQFVDMVFEQRQTARSYCTKLYRFFVKSAIDEEVETDIIEPLTQLLVDNDYEILPVVKMLLSSQHFYDADDANATDEIIGSIVKSPLQLITEVCTIFNVSMPNPEESSTAEEKLQFYQDFYFWFVHNEYHVEAGMAPFGPPSVAGHPAYFQEPAYDKNWFSSNTIIKRYQLVTHLLLGARFINTNGQGVGQNYASLDTLQFLKDNISDPADPNLIVSEMADLMYPEAISEDRVSYFKQFIIDETFPDYYWTNEWAQYINSGDDAIVKTRIDDLVTAMVNAAEFQIM